MHAPITPRVAAGAALWLAGWLINLQADHILINLRKGPGDKGEGFANALGGQDGSSAAWFGLAAGAGAESGVLAQVLGSVSWGQALP